MFAMADPITIPMWLLVVLIGGRSLIEAKSWWKNGGKGFHACQVERMLKDDPPRKHTDLLKDIHMELKMMRKDLKHLGTKSDG